MQAVTTMTLKRELERLRRELRSLIKAGQHENTHGKLEDTMRAGEKLTYERSGHALYDL